MMYIESMELYLWFLLNMVDTSVSAPKLMASDDYTLQVILCGQIRAGYLCYNFVLYYYLEN